MNKSTCLKVVVLHTWSDTDTCDWCDEVMYEHKFSVGDIVLTCISDVGSDLRGAKNITCKELSGCISDLKHKLQSYYDVHHKLPDIRLGLSSRLNFCNPEYLILHVDLPSAIEDEG